MYVLATCEYCNRSYGRDDTEDSGRKMTLLYFLSSQVVTQRVQSRNMSSYLTANWKSSFQTILTSICSM